VSNGDASIAASEVVPASAFDQIVIRTTECLVGRRSVDLIAESAAEVAGMAAMGVCALAQAS
jgi:hypothetical protein